MNAPAHDFRALSARAANEDVAWLRREYVHEALRGAIFQGESCALCLEHGHDELAERAFSKLVSFVRQAAKGVNELRGGAPDMGAPA